ncbi:MAG: hypothetical protein ACTSW7_00655 [Candidatus Thorarchaeota archaeon]|nr:MAG: hypothetical protein DRQ25_15460 [Candidatus Fermentibacteria bacterium]
MPDFKLSFVATADFRCSEVRNYLEAEQMFRPIEPDEVFLFISYSGNQLVWVLNVANGVIDTRRWRFLGNEKWDFTEIQSYALDVGINLVNFREFMDDMEKRM